MTLYSHEWRWITTPPPLAGQFSTNTNTWSTASTVSLNEKTDLGVDITAGMPIIKGGCRLRVQVKADSTKMVTYAVDGPGTDNGAYWTYPVSVVSFIGVPPTISTNTPCLVTLYTPSEVNFGQRECDEFDAEGWVIHKEPIAIIPPDPNTFPDMYWCQWCRGVWVLPNPRLTAKT